MTGFDKRDKPVFQGNRDVQTGLWMVDLRSLSTAAAEESAQAVSESSACAAIRLESTADFVNFWHATFGSPAVSMFIAAIDKGFIRVPGLTAAKVRRHQPNSVATAYGHLHATRQGIKSTKLKPPPVANTKSAVSDDNTKEIFATSEQRVWCQVDDVRVGRTHSDATGALPQRGRTGALYQIVFYHEDSNIIHVETSKSRTGNDLLAALQRAVKFFSDRGAHPILIRMDNECAEVVSYYTDQVRTDACRDTPNQ